MGKAKIEGYCHEDYEPVKKQFEHMIKKGVEENAQLCVYVGGDCVIDLYGSAKGDAEFNEDKITVSYFFMILLQKYIFQFFRLFGVQEKIWKES